MAELKDSGNRREFETGAVRDMQEGKGRMDLVPWGVCAGLYITMETIYANDRVGLIPKTDGRYCTGDLPDAYPGILDEMGNADVLLNGTDAQLAGVTPIERLRKLRDVFLKMAAIFCLYRLYIDYVPDISEDELEPFGIELINKSFGAAMLAVGKHYEDGARKYSENNWRKGMDPKIYFDSASRHLMKCMAGWSDEPHDRAFLWNCLCGAWECDAEIYKIENCYNTSYAVANVDDVKKAFSDLANKYSRKWLKSS